MSIVVTCACGKKMQTSEAARGKRIKCPACGDILPVPGDPGIGKVAPKPAAPPAKPIRLDDDDNDEGERPRKKKKKKRSGFKLPEFEFFGLTPAKLLVVLVIVGAIAGAIWMFVPSSTAQIAEVRRVDAYAALEIGEHSMNRIPEALKIMSRGIRRKLQRESGETVTDDEPDALILGDNPLLIVRDNPQGDSLVVRVRLSPRFLSKKANIQNGTIVVNKSDVILKGDGGEAAGLLIDTERALPKVLQVSFFGATNDSQFIPRERTPWNPPGQFSLSDLKKEIVPIDDKGHEGPSYTGAARFEGQGGMQVNYAYDGSLVELHWDKSSKAMVTSKSLQCSASQYTFGTLELTCVFARPPGRYATPYVMGTELSKMKIP
jgi:hypothetical protein